MNSTPYAVTEALDLFEASPNSSFSPVCHRTRHQTKIKNGTFPNDVAELEVAETVFELVNNVSCASPHGVLPGTPPRVPPTNELCVGYSLLLLFKSKTVNYQWCTPQVLSSKLRSVRTMFHMPLCMIKFSTLRPVLRVLVIILWCTPQAPLFK
ncbi:hypothetical protein CDAR_619811 [Caerostris darwini]|uniref:Uncharacterized protein n=1 Tax=Caerostris darwini TaxID=1538125 RepID=A0AAV4SEB6_9ARAC|nr:hypothetical protein CDAR_619811 [Caerostris darwini]